MIEKLDRATYEEIKAAQADGVEVSDIAEQMDTRPRLKDRFGVGSGYSLKPPE